MECVSNLTEDLRQNIITTLKSELNMPETLKVSCTAQRYVIEGVQQPKGIIIIICKIVDLGINNVLNMHV